MGHTMAHVRQIWLMRGAMGLTDKDGWPVQHWPEAAGRGVRAGLAAGGEKVGLAGLCGKLEKRFLAAAGLDLPPS